MSDYRPSRTSRSRASLYLTILTLAALLRLFPFFLIIALMVGPRVEDYLSRTEFDSATWKAAANKDDPVRLRMVDELIAEHKLLGKPRAEIDGLLGAPPQTSYFSEYQYVYWLGPERSFIPIDSEWLGIRFENDRVVEVKLLND
jgi:hypothetical protein